MATRHLIQHRSFNANELILINRNNLNADVEIIVRVKNGNTDSMVNLFMPKELYTTENLKNRTVIFAAPYADDWKYTYIGLVFDGWTSFHLYKAWGGAQHYDCVIYEIY